MNHDLGRRGYSDNARMHPLLDRLQPYPFERLRQLFAGITPDPKHRPISLGIGEPKHPTPQFIKDALVAGLDGLAQYPLTAGEPHLRDAFRRWLATRYGLMSFDANTQMLPVNGSREALFAFARAGREAARGGGGSGPEPGDQSDE